jgi:translation initiation factor 2B subunit (eIF-2B alpha/beta/delta family)
MMQELKTQKFKSYAQLKSFVQHSAKMLMQARATEPMMFNGMEYALSQLKAQSIKHKDVSKIQTTVIKALKLFLLDIQGEENIRPGI